ncbi:MAG: dTDP-3-amino-3,4,6-trideoxy-alpha-D-glucose transaminase [Actinomycetota bacterium]|jgi:dTDP-3-amino-3,4,6-trideoxy-alpha-D-glucose transaminase
MPVIPFADLGAIHEPMLEDLRAAFDRVVRSSAFNGGPEVEAFETAFAELVGVPHAVGVGSGTAALHLALVAAGIGPGDEVVLPPNTFVATAEAIVAAGATPVFADVEPDTALLDPAAVEAAVTDRTAAIAAVHLYGQVADMDRLGKLAEKRGLFLLEDAAQAVTSTWDGRQAGSLGAAAGFSFYPGKNLGALGEAGAVTTADPGLAKRVAQLRSHGESARYVHELGGVNERMDGLQAAFLNVKLPHLAELQRRRAAVVEQYRRRLAGVDGITWFATRAEAGHSHHLLVVQVDRRDAVLEAMRADGVQAMVHYPTPIHLQPAFAGAQGAGRFPVAEAMAERILSLPLFPHMTVEQVETSVAALRAAVEVRS